MLSKIYLSACAIGLLALTAIASCEAQAHTLPKWAQPAQSTPVQLGTFDESPELFDWQLILFFHDKNSPGEDGKVKRFIRAFNHDTKEECEEGKATVLALEPPPNIAPDGAVCVPLKKVVFPIDPKKV